jgi:pimeloyl-ACP methyl ester carboxylesterase
MNRMMHDFLRNQRKRLLPAAQCIIGAFVLLALFLLRATVAAQPVSGKHVMISASSRQSTGGTIYQVHYPAAAEPDELQISADYYVWIPAGVIRLRGVIVHQHGCGVGASIGGQTAADDLHWQALARQWNCALLGSCYEPREGINCRLWCDPRNGSGDRFLQALSHFAGATGHEELATVPWCLWGHSGGGFWASLMQVKYPQRIVAIWLRSGTAYGNWTSGEIEAPKIPDEAYQVPVMGNPGLKEKDDERFHSAWDGLIAMQQAYQAKGAFFELAPDPRTSHECGDSRYLAIPFFDFWLRHRLPAGADQQVLKPIAPAQAEWDAALAGKLSEYVRTGAVSDDSPPPAPRRVTANRNEDGNVTVAWEADADLESGIRCFLIERNGARIGQVPERPVGRFGRPLFQTMSYHDTPEPPLPAMQFTDRSAPAGDLPTYRVRTVNSVERQSKPTARH